MTQKIFHFIFLKIYLVTKHGKKKKMNKEALTQTIISNHINHTFRHLTESDRYFIERCLNNNLSTFEIANMLGVSKRTVQYEIICSSLQ